MIVGKKINCKELQKFLNHILIDNYAISKECIYNFHFFFPPSYPALGLT